MSLRLKMPPLAGTRRTASGDFQKTAMRCRGFGSIATACGIVFLAGCSPQPVRVSLPTPGVAQTCVAPTPAVMAWMRSDLRDPSSLLESNVTMVEIGNASFPSGIGDNTVTDWWIVADKALYGGTMYYETWLTDYPSTSDQSSPWMVIMGSAPNTADWSLVENWSEDLLDRGKSAQRLAVSCLGGTLN